MRPEPSSRVDMWFISMTLLVEQIKIGLGVGDSHSRLERGNCQKDYNVEPAHGRIRPRPNPLRVKRYQRRGNGRGLFRRQFADCG